MTLLVIIDIYLLSTWVNTINTINTNINNMYVVISYTPLAFGFSLFDDAFVHEVECYEVYHINVYI
jgi:hypothetical protein